MPTAFSLQILSKWLLTVLVVVAPILLRAQSDSVLISGQIKHLTPRLYRESPTVLITSNNILQAGRELAHPAPLQPDGSFRVAVPLIYPQEEMYVTAVGINTAFLAAAGELTIDIDADSLFVAAVPFRFGGVNAQVNQQFAVYKAYEARQPNVNGATLSQRIADLSGQRAFALLSETFNRPIRSFSATRPVFPLLTRWLTSMARYDAASFIYDRAIYTEQTIPATLTDSLRPPEDRLLTNSYATAMSRFTAYANGQVGVEPDRGIAIKQLVDLLVRYNRNLSSDEQTRLATIRQKGGASGADMRFLNALLDRNGGVIRRLLLFDVSMQQARANFDSAAVDYLEASSLASAMTTVPLAELPLMKGHIQPLISDPFLLRSLDEAYTRETKDSVAIGDATRRLATADSSRGSAEVATGILVTRNSRAIGGQLIERITQNNPGRVIYVLRWTPGDPQSQAMAQAAQRLRDTFSNRDLTVLYVNEPGVNATVWLESIIKQKLKGEHLYLTDGQWGSDIPPLPQYDSPAYLIGRNGKAQRRGAELPTEYEKAVEQIRRLLAGR